MLYSPLRFKSTLRLIVYTLEFRNRSRSMYQQCPLGALDMMRYLACDAWAILLCAAFSKHIAGIRKLIIVLCSLAAGLLLGATFLIEQPILMGPEHSWIQRTPWRESLSFFVMRLGMASKYLWDLIEVRR